MNRDDSQPSRSNDGEANIGRDKDLIESLIYSYKSAAPELTEKSLQRQPAEPAKARGAATSFSDRKSTALSSLSIEELSRQCISVFETCVRHESLMNNQWAENRFADFNLFVDGVGALSRSRASLDSRFESRPDDLVLVKSVLTMLKSFLVQCVSCAEAQSSTDAATKKVDSSLENLALIAVAIRKTGMRSRLDRADGRFKSEEHEELRDFLRIMCLRQRSRNEDHKDAGKKAEGDDFKFKKLSTQECINTLKAFKLSDPQHRLIEVNLRRRNRFLRAQEHSEKLKARQNEESAKGDDIKEGIDDEIELFSNMEALSLGSSKRVTMRDLGKRRILPPPTIPETKASTAEGSFQVRKAKKMASQPAMTAITALTAAVQYPKAPDACQKSTMFKCPCCCQTLPAEFGTDKNLWKKHLAEDISPYTCILPDCPTPFATYTTVFDWEKHFKREHRPCRVCPLCENADAVFSSMEDLATHIETEHAETASPDFILTAISWSGVATIGVSQCPLCDSTGPEHAPEFVRHVLGCIHDFSLLSLPWSGHDPKETSQHEWTYNLEAIGDREQPMRRWFENREDEGIDIGSLELDLRGHDRAQVQGGQPTNNYFEESENEFFGIASAQDSLEVFKRSLRSWDQEEDDTHALGALGSTDAASAASKFEDESEQDPEKSMQRQAPEERDTSVAENVGQCKENYFERRCKLLCAHVEQWVLRFSGLSHSRHARLTSEINDGKIIDRLDDCILDGSDVDSHLSDYVKRRDVFMSMMMNMLWEFIFTRYLFGMEREQRQKLKALEKLLTEIGPLQAVRQWRAVTLALFSKRRNYRPQCDRDTRSVVQEIFSTLSKVLPPLFSSQDQIESQLASVIKEAVELSVDMRTEKAEYLVLPPLRPEYDADGELTSLTYFNASLMREYTGNLSIPTNEDLETQRAVVRITLFPLVVKKGDDEGQGEEEIVVSPAQVLITSSRASSAATSNYDARQEELDQLLADLDDGNQERAHEKPKQVLTFSEHLFQQLDDEYFDRNFRLLYRNIQNWVLRFSKFSDKRACHLTGQINDEKTLSRLNNTILDGSDPDIYLTDRVKRRHIFRSLLANMLYEDVFCRYLFSIEMEQRQKLKTIESQLTQVGPLESIHQWRAITLTLLSKRDGFKEKRDSDTETVVDLIFNTLCQILPPPSSQVEQLLSRLRRIVSDAVSLSIDMRTQKAEYKMTPLLKSKGNTNDELVAKIPFNASTMNECSGMLDEELQAQGTAVRFMLFHPVVKKGDNDGYGDKEVVIYPGQVLVSVSEIQGSEVRAPSPPSRGFDELDLSEDEEFAIYPGQVLASDSEIEVSEVRDLSPPSRGFDKVDRSKYASPTEESTDSDD
ncbi:hypothetical protein ACHAQJ_002984 [Trichoderma viride]